ncbi:hypothetical protein [Streptomyces sp.]|uniref:hypothetical protein n=1 Tax=Streptomyces sp. TaxID=1931 RepID=UPI002D79AA1C|nr:hypothetical protein [Streptomyces sp.]HET6354116.1 hypothetical protein [Streptomyces sp.]
MHILGEILPSVGGQKIQPGSDLGDVEVWYMTSRGCGVSNHDPISSSRPVGRHHTSLRVVLDEPAKKKHGIAAASNR